ncbi:SpaH/EbpB family LPXTG-anchored major pilin [Leucobacter sp. VD1]|uniref:SpaH/EbpB family LPXTG-anchored major pilin n=1 Tax=Leucobacter sp. VD1 TaxID=3080381 RepID=UPI00301A5B1E
MSTRTPRGLLKGLGVLAVAAALALGGGVAANAAPVDQMPESSDIIITKTEQPSTGVPANGLPQTPPGAPIKDVQFAAYPVPVAGTPGTNAWQQAMAGTTLAQAQATASATASFTGTTDAAGVIRWNTVPRGLYLVRETSAPAGVVRAGDFLVSVPLTDPATAGNWLTEIYVYPKNGRSDVQKSVQNVSKLKVGDTVTWSIDTSIPDVRDPGTGAFLATDRFEIHDTLTDTQLSTTAAGVNVTSPGGFVKGAAGDYTVESVAAGSGATATTTWKVVFTASGRTKLAAALAAHAADTDPDKGPAPRVVVKIDSLVKSVGEIQNTALVFPDGSSITENKPLESQPSVVKYGSYALRKTSEGAPNGTTPNLAGAEFMVFANEAAARAGDPADAIKPSGNPTGVWTTDAQGRVDISGLRYSDFADGVLQTKFVDAPGETCADKNLGPASATCVANAKFQTYWLVEKKALQNHQLLAEPHPFLVNADSASTSTQTEAIVNQYNRNGFVLPLTGGTGTALLTIGGISVLAVVLIVARRRRRLAEAALEQ